MHPEAHDFVAAAIDRLGPFCRTVEFGSHDINGSIRGLFSGDFLGIDPQPGPGVDVVADAIEWHTGEPVDCVVCCEVFEHLADWRGLITSAARALRSGGVIILTMAGPGRAPHSAVDGNELRPDEHYANVEPDELADALAPAFDDIHVEQLDLDVRATARRR